MRRILIVCCLSLSAVFAAVTTPWASTPPCCAPVPSGIVSWWPGEAGASLTATPDVVTGWHGTMMNGATFAAGKVGQAWLLDGVDDYVEITDGETLYSAGSFSIDAWIQTTDDGVIAQHFECGNECSTNPDSKWSIEVDTAGQVVADITDEDGTNQVLVGTVDVADGAFHHIAVVRDVANLMLLIYVDGALDVSAPLTADGVLERDGIQLDPVTVGAGRVADSTALEDFLAGMIDELDYFNSALSGAEVASIAGAGAAGKCRDEVDPTSTASAPASATLTTIPVSYTANDAVGQLQTITLWVRAPGETTFTEVASRPTSDSSGFVYTATKGSGTYEFYTLAEDTSCGRELPPATPDAVTQVNLGGTAVTPTPTPTPTPAPVVPRPVTVPIRQIARLPSARRCVSRRRFRIRLRTITKDPVVAAEIRIRGRLKKRVRGRALTVPVNLRGLPRGRWTVRITVTTKSGAKKVGKRRYRTCARRRR